MRSIEDVMGASTRGEVLRNVPFVEAARRNDVLAVIGTYAIGVVVSLILSASFYDSAGTRVFVTILTWAAWAAVGYVFIAIGTKLSHNVATWGVALVAGVLAALNVLGATVGLATLNTANTILAGSDVHVAGAGTFVTLMLISAAVATGAFVLTVKTSRAMTTLYGPPTATTDNPPHPQRPYGSTVDTSHTTTET